MGGTLSPLSSYCQSQFLFLVVKSHPSPLIPHPSSLIRIPHPPSLIPHPSFLTLLLFASPPSYVLQSRIHQRARGTVQMHDEVPYSSGCFAALWHSLLSAFRPQGQPPRLSLLTPQPCICICYILPSRASHSEADEASQFFLGLVSYRKISILSNINKKYQYYLCNSCTRNRASVSSESETRVDPHAAFSVHARS